MRKIWILAALVLLIAGSVSLPLTAAGGSTTPSTSPADQAADAYNRGLRYRDKAWKLEEQMATAEGAEREKLAAKVGKEYQKAARAFRSAIEANPNMYQALSSLGYALRKTGDFEGSLAAYNKALELQPSYTEAIEYRAEAYLGLNRLEEVKQSYLRLFRDDRERADELMSAMRTWVEKRSADPAGLDSGVIEEFAAWVEERSEIAAQTANLTAGSSKTW